MTGKLGVPLPERWDEIPGAKGCATIYEANSFIINYRGISLHKKSDLSSVRQNILSFQVCFNSHHTLNYTSSN
tara:strand:- start:295 stop:513 length:219 start_codon:yes stop_codon:yes gene_type:complete